MWCQRKAVVEAGADVFAGLVQGCAGAGGCRCDFGALTHSYGKTEWTIGEVRCLYKQEFVTWKRTSGLVLKHCKKKKKKARQRPSPIYEVEV